MSRESATPTSKGAGPQHSPDLLYRYLRRNGLTYRNEIWCGDACSGVACFRRSAAPPSQGCGAQNSQKCGTHTYTETADLQRRNEYDKTCGEQHVSRRLSASQSQGVGLSVLHIFEIYVHAHIVWETTTEFSVVIKLGVRQIFTRSTANAYDSKLFCCWIMNDSCTIYRLLLGMSFYCIIVVWLSMCSLCCFSCQYLPSDWLERLLWGSLESRSSSPERDQFEECFYLFLA